MMNNKAIILMSGGLDSVTALSETINTYAIRFGLFFYYGQKAYKHEMRAVKEITDYYGIRMVITKLDWYENLLDDMQTDWVPNRNGVFVNIASAYAERLGISNVIIGINKEEAAEFKDNSQEFLDTVNAQLKYSTQNDVRVVAPFVNNTKDEIVQLAIKNQVPLEMIYSCYRGEDRHCGECKSCRFLKSALIKNGKMDIIGKLF